MKVQLTFSCHVSLSDDPQDVAWFYERYLARRLLRRRTLGPAAEVLNTHKYSFVPDFPS
jgi:hypothetical protein